MKCFKITNRVCLARKMRFSEAMTCNDPALLKMNRILLYVMIIGSCEYPSTSSLCGRCILVMSVGLVVISSTHTFEEYKGAVIINWYGERSEGEGAKF